MKILFYLLILLLPTQLGRHFWPDFSYVSGIRVDYLSPTVYLTDIIIILILLGGIIAYFTSEESRSLPRHHPRWLSGAKLVLSMIFVVVILIGIYLSQSPLAGFYGLIKVTEFLLLGFFIAKTVRSFKEINNIATLLSVGVIFQSLLAVAQFVNQSSLGGIFWFFGERTFTGSTIGIANAVLDGQLILRPYGTFPHPNVLAGFLVVAMTLIILNLKSKILNLALIIGTLGLLLTMSRVAIIIWLLVISSWFISFFRKNKLIGLLVVLVFVGSIGIIYPRFIDFSFTDESVVRRIELTQAAVEMVKTSPLFGVGLNNFLVNLPDFQTTKNTILYLQPVHNIYLLILAETGIVGLGIFVWFLFKTYQRIIHNSLFMLLTVILILGLFDHYFLTLQQGQLLFTLTLGLCWARIKK